MAIVLNRVLEKGHYRITIELAVRKYRSNAKTVLKATALIRRALVKAFPHK